MYIVLSFLTQTSACLQTLFEAFQYIITQLYILCFTNIHMQWVGTKQSEFQVNSMQLLYYQVNIPYSKRYWRELNLAVGSQMAIAIALADLAVRYGIAIRIYASKKFWQILIWRLLR